MKSLSVVVCAAALLAAPSLASAGPVIYIDPDRVTAYDLTKAFYGTKLTVGNQEWCGMPQYRQVVAIEASEGDPEGTLALGTPPIATTGTKGYRVCAVPDVRVPIQRVV